MNTISNTLHSVFDSSFFLYCYVNLLSEDNIIVKKSSGENNAHQCVFVIIDGLLTSFSQIYRNLTNLTIIFIVKQLFIFLGLYQCNKTLLV